MCGRFTLRTPATLLAELFGGEPPAELPLRYNIAPTQGVAIVRIDPKTGTRHWQMARWGLIPAWAKDPSIGNRMINARAESVGDKPAYRTAFRRRRCLVPADGYFEWQKTGRAKQPYYIQLSDGSPFAMAGLWDAWIAPDSGSPLESCTVITTDANHLTRSIHDRMPVILPPDVYDRWLDPQLQAVDTLCDLLRPFDGLSMRAVPVSTHVNNPRNDDPGCIAVQNGS